jgi:hypothetical protein
LIVVLVRASLEHVAPTPVRLFLARTFLLSTANLECRGNQELPTENAHRHPFRGSPHPITAPAFSKRNEVVNAPQLKPEKLLTDNPVFQAAATLGVLAAQVA